MCLSLLFALGFNSSSSADAFPDPPLGRDGSKEPTDELFNPTTIKDGDDVIVEYDAGIYVRITEPGDNSWVVRTSLSDEAADITKIEDIVARHVPESDRFQLRETGVIDSRAEVRPDSKTFRVRQRLSGLDSPGLTVSRETINEEAQVRVQGILISPDLPQLDPNNWMPLSDAQSLAAAALRPYAKGLGSEWFAEAAKEGTLRGEKILLIDRRERQLLIDVVYRVHGHYSYADVNLYSNEIAVISSSLSFITNESKSHVCKPGQNPYWPYCYTDPNEPLYPQATLVFGEAGNGDRVCTADPPFNFPTSAECATPAYIKMHEVVRQSEDLLSSTLPLDCCFALGAERTYFGGTYFHLDLLTSWYPSALGNHPGFYSYKQLPGGGGYI